jgi:hypothetical protein
MRGKPTVKGIMECLGRYRYWIIIPIMLCLMGGEIYALRHELSTTFKSSGLWAILPMSLEMAFLWLKRDTIKRLIGEYRPQTEPEVETEDDTEEDRPETEKHNIWSLVKYDIPNLISRLLLGLILMLLFLAFTIYFLVGDEQYKTIPTVAQFSIVAVAPTLGGLILAAAAALKESDSRRLQLIRISQKFIVATVLFIIFVPSLVMVNVLHGINVTSFSFSNLRDSTAWARGIYFWLAVPCFYSGLVLFLWGLRDLVHALMGLASTIKQEPGQ